ncbi:hypothetical protein OAX78_04295 [Planctomycetota bacterium]|nr:hypothetical protein [Planctomycetota bacterium]
MSDTHTITETQPRLGAGTGNKIGNLRHYVELDKAGKPTDQCLCGHLWDRLHVRHNGDICQPCVDELKRRGHG